MCCIIFFIFKEKIRIWDFFFFQAEDGIRDVAVTGVQTCALPIYHGALPIQRFWPFRIHVSPSRLAVVVMPPLVPEPTNGSVRPKQPIFSHRAIGGSHFCFCSSEPSR